MKNVNHLKEKKSNNLIERLFTIIPYIITWACIMNNECTICHTMHLWRFVHIFA